MKANQSPLILEKIFILASNIIAVPDDDESGAILNDFEIEVDFDIYSEDDNTDHKRVVVSISGNNFDEPSPGYCFSVVAQGTFSFSKATEIEKHDKDMLLSRSAIPIVIGQVRSYISSLTAHGPHGLYLLPAIDMNDLLEKKSAEKG
jgi:preprotein translocase subunit SecB